MVLACFDQQGMFSTNCVLLGITANAAYTLSILFEAAEAKKGGGRVVSVLGQCPAL
jgi:hypothetical protein